MVRGVYIGRRVQTGFCSGMPTTVIFVKYRPPSMRHDRLSWVVVLGIQIGAFSRWHHAFQLLCAHHQANLHKLHQHALVPKSFFQQLGSKVGIDSQQLAYHP